jgi:hypothetical protein
MHYMHFSGFSLLILQLYSIKCKAHFMSNNNNSSNTTDKKSRNTGSLKISYASGAMGIPYLHLTKKLTEDNVRQFVVKCSCVIGRWVWHNEGCTMEGKGERAIFDSQTMLFFYEEGKTVCVKTRHSAAV